MKMRAILNAFIIVAAASAALNAQTAAPAASYKTLKYPPLHKIKVPEPARFELANGMVVYLVEDHELPTITASALIRTGARLEPVDKAGLASITGTVMRTGGTPTRNGDQLDEELDRLAAHVETGIDDDSGGASVAVLKEDIDKGLTILSDILQHPAFPEDKIELAKITEREGVARRNDDAAEIASREFDRIIYGRNSAYGHITEYDTIASITRDDLVAFHKKYFQPENVILGVWGDFAAADMRTRIEKAFGGWARGNQPRPPVPEVEAGARDRAGVYFIPKDDVNQSSVYMGFLGGKRNDPDFYALTVANTILGSGFTSRLVNHVRSDQGLAYHVGSSWSAGWDRPGMFVASGGTKSESTVKMVNAIRTQIGTMSESVSDDELARAKDFILKGFAFDFDSTGKIVRRLMSYEYYGYPKDYLQQYEANIDKVAKDDVLRVSKQYLKTDQLAILVLGRQKDFDQPLSTLGKVATIDIAIPKPKQAELAAATPEAIAKGKELLAAARQATGGEALTKVRAFSSKGEMKITMPQGAMAIKFESIVDFSGKMLQKMQTPMGEMTIAYDGQGGWIKMGQNTRDLPGAQKAEMDGGIFRETVGLLRDFDKYNVQALGADEVAVTDPARKMQVKVYLDPNTHLIAKKVFTASIMGPPAETEEIYSDYRDVDGVKIPFAATQKQAGQTRSEQTVSEVKINPDVPPSEYVRK
jgi:predicted Zn-dependent peptidase